MIIPKSSIAIVCAVIVASVVALLPVTDNIGHEHIDTAFKRALAAAAIARGLNGVISVAQGTELGIQPAGVGVNFTPGEILDPVNDLVERFSWIMLLASSSLGVQKVLLEMSEWQILLFALVLVALLLIASHFFSAVSNDFVYRTFLESNYIESSAALRSAQEAIGEINTEVRANTKAPESVVERAVGFYKNIVDKIDLENRYERYRVAAGEVGENAIDMIVVFIMQTLVFPLIFLGILFGVLRRLTYWR